MTPERLRLEVEQGDVLVKAATFWDVGPDAFVVAMTLREKHAAGEVITSGALQQLTLHVVPGATSRDGDVFPGDHVRHDTLVTFNEPGWLLGIMVSRYTAVITGVRGPVRRAAGATGRADADAPGSGA